MTITTSLSDVRMHVSLDTGDLAAAVAFYTAMFGRPPAKRRADWAKFELEAPALVFSLNAAGRKPQGRLSHLGMRVADQAALAAMRRRLAAAGLAVQEEQGTTCCYARQDKVWVTDPDGNAWEFYVLVEDVEATSAANVPGGACGTGGAPVAVECCVPRP